eukprot:11739404-Alexandrium_andersonii.AAC.1
MFCASQGRGGLNVRGCPPSTEAALGGTRPDRCQRFAKPSASIGLRECCSFLRVGPICSEPAI